MRKKYILCTVFVLFLTNIGVSDTIMNPSFESYSLLTSPTGLLDKKMPNYWNWRSQGNINGFACEVWSSESDLALYMYCHRWNEHYAGDYLEFYQIIDLTGIDTISFDVKFSSLYLFSKPYVSINSQKLWSKTGSGEALGESIDTSSFSGMCEIVLGLEVLIPFSYPSYEWSDGSTYFDNFIVIPETSFDVNIDIKPTACPNPLNVKSKGVLPIAILGTDDYDITTIDPTSIRLAGVEPIRSGYEDVATPVSDTNDCNCITDGPDGFLDLTLKFETQRIVEAIGDVNDGDVRVLTLTGVLFDETPIEGTDCVLIKGKYKPINKADINKDGVVDYVSILPYLHKTGYNQAL